eukprot:1160396-Pelagomonas_calceolata.AAC.20
MIILSSGVIESDHNPCNRLTDAGFAPQINCSYECTYWGHIPVLPVLSLQRSYDLLSNAHGIDQ